MWVQDWGRLATVGGIGLSLFGSACFGGLMLRSSKWAVYGLATVFGLAIPLMQDLKQPEFWHPIQPTFFQSHFKAMDRQAVVVFPFESSDTILDGLALPNHRMVNPLRSQDPPRPEHSTALRWMFELGKGNPIQQTS